jgi:hypothetical protein
MLVGMGWKKILVGTGAGFDISILKLTKGRMFKYESNNNLLLFHHYFLKKKIKTLHLNNNGNN